MKLIECPYRQLARRMDKLCAPRVFQPAIPFSEARRIKNAQTRRKQRGQLRARIRRHRGRSLQGVQYRVPRFDPLPQLK